jgi:hypothetical protein
VAVTSELAESEVRACAEAAYAVEPGMVVYADRQPRLPGPAVLVFRDEQPGANWMHPCSYALVAVDGRVVLERRVADRPPVFGRLPSSWVVVSDPDGLADLVPDSPFEE